MTGVPTANTDLTASTLLTYTNSRDLHAPAYEQLQRKPTSFLIEDILNHKKANFSHDQNHQQFAQLSAYQHIKTCLAKECDDKKVLSNVSQYRPIDASWNEWNKKAGIKLEQDKVLHRKCDSKCDKSLNDNNINHSNGDVTHLTKDQNKYRCDRGKNNGIIINEIVRNNEIEVDVAELVTNSSAVICTGANLSGNADSSTHSKNFQQSFQTGLCRTHTCIYVYALYVVCYSLLPNVSHAHI